MQSVAAIYQRTINQQQTVQEKVSAAPPEAHVRVARHWAEQTDSQILARLAVDSPELSAIASALPLGSVARRNVFRVLSATAGEDERYAGLLRNAELLREAIPVLATSSLVTDILVRHPEDLSELAHARPSPSEDEGANGSQGATAAELETPEITGAEESTQSAVMAQLRRSYRRSVLRSCMRDCLSPRPVWDSLAELTGAAEAAIGNAFNAMGAPDGCAVLALGRLGTAEFDVLSDADLLFVYGDSVASEQAAAAAAALLTLLGSYTSDGIVFTVDMRLRPHGNQGELATSISQLARYFQTEAQPWEALTYTKLRHIAGSAEIAAEVAELVLRFHRRFSADLFGGELWFHQQLREMRTRLEDSVGRERNFKQGWGGFYDIDFIVGGLSIEHGLAVAACDIIARLTALRRAGLLAEQDFSSLCHYAWFLRALEHWLRVVYGAARSSLPSSTPDLQAVSRLMQPGRELPEMLPDSLNEALRAIRTIFERIFSV
jgi:glutamate-ammonia-ligase adenylyltransferase